MSTNDMKHEIEQLRKQTEMLQQELSHYRQEQTVNQPAVYTEQEILLMKMQQQQQLQQLQELQQQQQVELAKKATIGILAAAIGLPFFF